MTHPDFAQPLVDPLFAFGGKRVGDFGFIDFLLYGLSKRGWSNVVTTG